MEDKTAPVATLRRSACANSAHVLRRTPVQARAKERIERMLDATEEVFAEVGYDKATTNMIASRARTSVGSVYEFFGNKEALAEALAHRYVGELTALYGEVLGDDPGGRDVIVVKVVDALDGFYTRHPGVAPLLRGWQGSEDLHAAGAVLEASFVEHVERLIAIRRDSVDSRRRRVVAQVCTSVLRCTLDDLATAPERERSERLAELKLVLTSYLAAALPR